MFSQDAVHDLTTRLASYPDERRLVDVNRWRSNMMKLIKFNLKVANKRQKPRQIFGPIIANILLINLMRLIAPDYQLWPLRNLTVFDTMSGCVYRDESMAFFCDKASLSSSVCDAVFEAFSDEMQLASISVLRYADSVSYRSAVLDLNLGVQFLSMDTIDIDVSAEDYLAVSTEPMPTSTECRVINDPDCAPVSSVYSCTAAVELGAMNALHGTAERKSFRLFPMPSKQVNGLAQSSSLLWVIPLYLSGLFLNIFNFALIELVTEKQGRKIDYLVSWGITTQVHFLSWLLSNCIYGCVVIAMVVYGLCATSVLQPTFWLAVTLGSVHYFVALVALAYVMGMKVKSAEAASRFASIADLIFNVSAIGVSTFHNTLISFCFALIPTVPFFLLIRAVILQTWINTALAMGFVTMCVFLIWANRANDKIRSVHPADSAVVDMRNLTYRYPGADRDALNSVSLKIEFGEIVGLVGKNGCGKSTLINQILLSHNAARIAICFQEDCFWESLTVQDHLDFFALTLANSAPSLLNEYVQKLTLLDCLNQECTTLSGGQKRRLSVLLALLRAESDPDIQLVILDEATTGVDVEGRRTVWDLIRRVNRKTSVLFTTHYLDEAALLADRVCFLSEGKVAAFGSVMELNAQFGGGVVVHAANYALFAAIPHLKAVQLPGDKIRLMGPPASIEQGLALLSEKCVVESVSLDNLFEQLHPNTVAPPFNSGPSGNSKNSQVILSVTRIRVLPYFSSMGSFFSKIVLPILLIVLSGVLRSVSVSNTQSLLLPRMTSNVLVAVKGNPVLPATFHPVLVPDHVSMWDFLQRNPDFAFALEGDRTIWLRPDYGTKSVPLSVLRELVSSETKVSLSTFLTQPMLVPHVAAAMCALVMYVVFSLSLISTQSSANLIDEKTLGIKRLGQIQGMTPFQYWCGSLLGHLVVSLPIVWTAVIVAIAMMKRLITEVPSSLEFLFVASILCATQVILFGYFSLFIFQKKETMLKFNSLVSIVLFEGFVLWAVAHIIASNGDSLLLFMGALFAPPFTIAAVLAKIVSEHLQHCSVVTEVCVWPPGWNLWTSSGGMILLGSVVQIFFLVLILVVSEKKSRRNLRNVNWAVQEQLNTDCCLSVLSERQRILAGATTDDDVLFVKLWHMYPGSPSWAVRDLTLGVRKGEVLALLGSNGAGKTTALSILLRTIDPVAGYAGIWSGRTVGFCPQENSLWPKLDAIEHVMFYSRLRGIAVSEAPQKMLLAVGIGAEDQRKVTSTYSGGMKRRLCIAIALIGNPAVLVLDEPTAGVDIGGKRDIWQLIMNLRASSTSVLITTHSLEEADYLATRISIMDKGALVKVGAASDWKREQKKVRVAVQYYHQTITFVQEQLEKVFGNIGWQDHEFELDMTKLGYAELFKQLNTLVRENVINDYTVRQLSLEDVFLKTISSAYPNT